MRTVVCLGALSIGMACGCRSFDSPLEVIVADPSGAPIVGAAVSAQTPSISGPPILTDETGRASIPRNMIQDVQWISVKAPGFDSKQLNIPDATSITIMLCRTAEETFKKIEGMIEDAKTLSIKFRQERASPPGTWNRVSAFLQSGGRAWYSDYSSGAVEQWSLCDGRLVQRTRHPLYDEGIHEPFRGTFETWQAPEGLEKNLKIAISRCGFMMDLLRIAFDPGDDLDLSKELRVSNLRHGDQDGLASTLIYSLQLGKGSNPSVVKIWYDPQTFRLLKRTKTDQLKTGRQVTTIETYDDFVLNAPVDEKKFKRKEE